MQKGNTDSGQRKELPEQARKDGAPLRKRRA